MKNMIACMVYTVFGFGLPIRRGAQALDGDVDRMVANRQGQRAPEARVRVKREKGAVRARARGAR